MREARFLLVACLLCLASGASARPLQDMDVFALEWALDPQVAPDGRQIAYVRRGYDVMTDREQGRVWLAGADGEGHRPVADQPGASPRWSPSGDRIAFLSATDEGVEVYMHWLADNRTARLTQLAENPQDLVWSPSGDQLAFAMFVPAEPDPMVKMPTPPEGAQWAPGARVFEQLNYRADGAGFLRPGFTHVFVLPADGGTPRQVTDGDYHHTGGIDWAPDGTHLYVSANRRDDWEFEFQDSAIYRVSLEDGQVVRLTERYGPESSPAVSPDGRLLAFTGYADRKMGYHNRELSVLELSSGEVRSLTGDLDRSVESPVWDAGGRGLYAAYDDRGEGVIAHVPLRGALSVITRSLGGTSMGRPYTGGAFHAAGGTLAYTHSEPLRPADVALAGNGQTRLVTRLNEDALGHLALASIERFEVASRADGRPVEAWAAFPPDFDPDERYPLILEIHGGPFAAYGPHFATEVQLYAAAGYLVIYVNPRGSTSYGDEFANLIHHNYPGEDFDDLMSAVDHAVAAGWADPDALFVTGGSGGGILTAWIVTHTDRFRAAVAQKPVINWYSMTFTTDIATLMYPYWFA
jgi:dipeptidyl aminopeptidase/acylaminoacyl peptidase